MQLVKIIRLDTDAFTTRVSGLEQRDRQQVDYDGNSHQVVAILQGPPTNRERTGVALIDRATRAVVMFTEVDGVGYEVHMSCNVADRTTIDLAAKQPNARWRLVRLAHEFIAAQA